MLNRGGWHIDVLGCDEVRDHFRLAGDLVDAPDQLGAGGGTPIIEALQLATPWLIRRQRHKPGEQQRLLLLTDGRLRDWPRLTALPCPGLLLDIERAPIRLGRTRQLAQALLLLRFSLA
mgnify:FL=1